MLYAILILAALLAVAIFVIVMISKSLAKQKIIVKQQKEIIEQKDKNIKILQDYQAARQEILKDNYHMKQKIKEARNDKEVDTIIDDIIKLNNSRMQND